MSRVQAWLEEEMAAAEVKPINFVLRKTGTGVHHTMANTVDTQRGPVNSVHCDFTDDAPLVMQLRRRQREDPRLAGGRFMLINFWRSIGMTGPVQQYPLAVCDSTSVPPSDLVARRTPENGNHVYNALASQGHQWSFFPNMTAEEMLIFKTWDEDACTQRGTVGPGGVSKFSLHSAFELEHAPPDVPARESVEVRFAVFWGPLHQAKM
jgi:hypothetical protein